MAGHGRLLPDHRPAALGYLGNDYQVFQGYLPGRTRKRQSRSTSKSSTTASGVIRVLATYRRHRSLKISEGKCRLLETDVPTIDSTSI